MGGWPIIAHWGIRSRHPLHRLRCDLFATYHHHRRRTSSHRKGFYPSGEADANHGFEASGMLVKVRCCNEKER